MKLLSFLLGILVFAAALIFALDNRQIVTVSLWPFDAEISAPLFVMTLGCLAAGIVFGGAIIWLGHLPHRFMSRRLGKDVVTLSDKLVELERELEQYRARMAADEPPLLPSKLRWKFWER